MKTYLLTGSTPQAITVRPLLRPSGLGGVTIPWANISNVTTHLSCVIVHTNDRSAYKINRGTGDAERLLVEQTFGLTSLATSTTRQLETEEKTAELRAAKNAAKTEAKTARSHAKADAKQAEADARTRSREAIAQVKAQGGNRRERLRAALQARKQEAAQ